jgi:hypothetical protein
MFALFRGPPAFIDIPSPIPAMPAALAEDEFP